MISLNNQHVMYWHTKAPAVIHVEKLSEVNKYKKSQTLTYMNMLIFLMEK